MTVKAGSARREIDVSGTGLRPLAMSCSLAASHPLW